MQCAMPFKCESCPAIRQPLAMLLVQTVAVLLQVMNQYQCSSQGDILQIMFNTGQGRQWNRALRSNKHTMAM